MELFQLCMYVGGGVYLCEMKRIVGTAVAAECGSDNNKMTRWLWNYELAIVYGMCVPV